MRDLRWEVGTAVGVVVTALWGEVGTAAGVDCCEGSEIAWIIYLLRVWDSSRCCSEGSEVGTEDVVK